jgi:hypothetical protein
MSKNTAIAGDLGHTYANRETGILLRAAAHPSLLWCGGIFSHVEG